MVKLREDTRESIAKLTLMDDIFMNKVFENDTERTALLLRIILNNDKIKVIKAVTQQKLKNLSGHDLHLDILAHVKEALEKIKGVEEATADHETGKVVLKLSKEIDDKKIADAVKKAGYKVV